MKAPRCFHLLRNPSTKRDNRGWGFDCCLPVGCTPYYQWLFQPHIFYHLLSQTLFLVLGELCYWLVPYLWCLIWAVIHGIYRISSTLWVVLVCMLTSLQHERLWRVQKICFRAFCSSSFWCISYSARYSYPEYSYGSLLLCHGLFFVAPVHGVGFGSKFPSALSALQLVCQQGEISSGSWHSLQMTLGGGSHNWVWTGFDRCWHFWYCCRQIRLSIIALPNHLAPNWQMLWATPPLCCFVSLFGNLFEGKRL